MNIVDIIIIAFLLLVALVGWKQVFTKSLVNCDGYILIIIIAFLLKNPLSELMMTYLPFFDFFGAIKGITVLNIALYEILAFLIIFSLLLIVLKVLMVATSIFETILKFTIILGIPSKILGAILGFVKNYVITFMVLYILTLPMITGNEILNDSKFTKPILESTPALSLFADKTLKVANDFATLKDEYTSSSSSNEFNLETLDLFLKYDIVQKDTVQKLIDKGKINIDGVENVLNKYEEE